MKPSLTLILDSAASPERIHGVLEQWKPLAEQIILTVPNQIAQKHPGCELADQTVLYPLDGHNRPLRHLISRAEGEWILYLPALALPSSELADNLADLLRRREVDAWQLELCPVSPDHNNLRHLHPEHGWQHGQLVRNNATLRLTHEREGESLQPLGSRFGSLPFPGGYLLGLEWDRDSLQDREQRVELLEGSHDGLLGWDGQPVYRDFWTPAWSRETADLDPADQDLLQSLCFDTCAPGQVESLDYQDISDIDDPAKAGDGEIRIVREPQVWTSEGKKHLLHVQVTNLSNRTWPGSSTGAQVALLTQWSGQPEPNQIPLPYDLRGGESMTVPVYVDAPDFIGKTNLQVALAGKHGLICQSISLQTELQSSVSTQLVALEEDGKLDPTLVWNLRAKTGRSNSLWEDREQIRREPSYPQSEHIKSLLSADMSVGDGALDGETLDRIEALFHQIQPAGVVEFGSGSSTIVLGSLLAQQYGKNQVRMVSVEQDAGWCELTRQRLQKAGLDGVVQVYHAPLEEGPGGLPAACYSLSDECQEHIRRLQPQLCLIDGPAYRAGQTRVQVWHKVKDLLAPGAHVLLDDSFRDPELWIAKRWADDPGLEMLGIWATSKGVTHIRLPGSD